MEGALYNQSFTDSGSFELTLTQLNANILSIETKIKEKNNELKNLEN